VPCKVVFPCADLSERITMWSNERRVLIQFIRDGKGFKIFFLENKNVNFEANFLFIIIIIIVNSNTLKQK
jgi:hypothetical protein